MTGSDIFGILKLAVYLWVWVGITRRAIKGYPKPAVSPPTATDADRVA